MEASEQVRENSGVSRAGFEDWHAVGRTVPCGEYWKCFPREKDWITAGGLDPSDRRGGGTDTRPPLLRQAQLLQHWGRREHWRL